jgi:uncharacterized protein YukE
MAILHMETDTVRDTGRRLNHTALEIFDQVQRLAGSWALLQVDWMGPACEQYSADMEACIQMLRRLSDAMDSLGFCALREANQWDEVDACGAMDFAGMGHTARRP